MEILVASGSPEDGGRIVLAITAHHECRTNWECATRIWPDSSNTYSATRCLEWSVPREWDTADEVDCPKESEIDIAPVETVELPEDAEIRLEEALREDDAAAGVRDLGGVPGLAVHEEGDADLRRVRWDHRLLDRADGDRMPARVEGRW